MPGLRRRHGVVWTAAFVTSLFVASAACGQTPEPSIVHVDLPIGRSFPITTASAVTKVSVANPDVADVAVIAEREVVINARAAGESDVILYLAPTGRQHYRVVVHSAADRMQIALSVKFAEVRRDFLRDLGVSAVYRDAHVRVGSDKLRTDDPFQSNGSLTFPGVRFLSILTDFDTDKLLALLEAEETNGRGRILSEPTILAANKEQASFLAGGEIPVPVVQGGGGGDLGARVTIQYREFGVRLRFQGEIISDSLIKLAVRPEVSSLDFANAILIQGFRIPALRTRRIESTVDVKRNESLIISGMFNEETERVKTGVPLLMDVPILGQLFSSSRFQRNESELIIVVSPVLIDPMRPRPRDVLRFAPDTALPAREALEKRLPRPQQAAPPQPPQ